MTAHRHLRDGSREVHLPRVQVRIVARLLLTDGVRKRAVRRCSPREWQSYGLMLQTYDCRWAAGDACSDIGGAKYVSRSVKQVSGWLI